MARSTQSANVKSLSDIDVPALYDEQLRHFTRPSIHSSQVMTFDNARTADVLARQEGQQVVAADFGGDKGVCRLLTVRHGALVTDSAFFEDVQGDDGKGYLQTLQQAARYAEARNIPLGISWGGPLDGTKLVYHPKAKQFYDDTQAAFGADLMKLSPKVAAILNDGPAGLISGAVEAYLRYKADTVICIINGSGIGLGVLKDGNIYATEAGHVEGYSALNTYHQTEPCGVFGATYVCMERLGANKAGIEAQWQARTDSYMRAKDIEVEYKAGNAFAAELYDHSALVVAHVVQGAAQALDIEIADPRTVVVGHGGAFKFPGYGQRIAQILGAHNRGNIRLIMTNEYTDPASNACLDGVAIAALTAVSR